MRIFLVIVMLFSLLSVNKIKSETNVQNLSCYYMDGDTRYDDLWIIDADKMFISFWNNQDDQFQAFPITKLDKKTVAWNQIGNVFSVFVLDKSTMRQSGTIISTNEDGQSIIEKRWFSDCNFISHDQLDALTKATQ